MAYTTIDDPTIYFNTKLYTGTGSSHAITGVGFSPNWVWIKHRNEANPHKIFDTVRGVGKSLKSNSTDAEASDEENGYVSAFGSDGFTLVGGSTSSNDVNKSSGSYVAWNWKAGTTGSGTTTGTGTGKAYSYSVNTTSGFSIVKYLGNGSAGHTIPHHLGAVPKMIIVKRDAATNWSTYHASTGNGKSDPLNEGEVPTTATTFWNDTTPTSSVFTVGSISNTNSNDSSVIAYCFAEKQGYSKFGSYTGNGNADGTFVYLGFKPAFVMWKRTDTANNWMMGDNKQTPFNPQDNMMRADLANAQLSTNPVDFLSNGFKIRLIGNAFNGSGGTYIYMAFAESPLVSSTGVPGNAR